MTMLRPCRLYSLPETQIQNLKNLRFGIDPAREEMELNLLKKLPKAELHCHLGGVADAAELVRIAATAKKDIAQYMGGCLRKATLR